MCRKRTQRLDRLGVTGIDGVFGFVEAEGRSVGYGGYGSRICLFCFCGIIPVIALLHTGRNLTSGHYSVLLGSAKLSHILLQGANVFDLIL